MTDAKAVQAALEAGLDRAFWRQIVVEEQLSSTNDRLTEFAERGAPQGTLVIALSQTAGRGRRGRRWASPPGGAWFSLLLKPLYDPAKLGSIVITLAVAVATALRVWLALPVRVKWPNDLILYGRKLGGILVEVRTKAGASQGEWLIAGIGVNVNNRSPAGDEAISLREGCGEEVDLKSFFTHVLAGIEAEYHRFLENGFGSIVERWKMLSVTWGRRVSVERAGRRFVAEVLGLSANGALIVKTEDGIERLVSGEVSLIV